MCNANAVCNACFYSLNLFQLALISLSSYKLVQIRAILIAVDWRSTCTLLASA
jgi:hypothetical protein